MKNQLILLSLFFILPFFVSAQKDSTLKRPLGFRNNVKISPLFWWQADVELEHALSRLFSLNIDLAYGKWTFGRPGISLMEYARFYPLHRKETFTYNKGFYFLAGLYEFYDFIKFQDGFYPNYVSRTRNTVGINLFGGIGYQLMIGKRLLIDLYVYGGPRLWAFTYIPHSHVSGDSYHLEAFKLKKYFSIKFGFAF